MKLQRAEGLDRRSSEGTWEPSPAIAVGFIAIRRRAPPASAPWDACGPSQPDRLGQLSFDQQRRQREAVSFAAEVISLISGWLLRHRSSAARCSARTASNVS